MLRSFRYTTGAGFLVLLLLMGALVGFGLMQLHSVREHLESVVSEHNRKVNVVTDIQISGYRRSDSLYIMTLLEDPFERDTLFMGQYNPAAFAVGSARAAFKGLGLAPREQRIYERQSTLIADVVEVQDRVVELLAAGERERANLLMLERVVPLQEAINGTFGELRQVQMEATDAALAAAQDTYEVTRTVFLGLGLGFLAVGALVAGAVFRKTAAQAETIAENLRDLERSHRQLERAAHYDPLTELPNRSLFAQRLEETLARSGRRGRALALLYFDLDHFKQVNDTLGHHGGDALLRSAARRIRDCLRSRDMVARVGGDEFVAIVEDVADPEEAAAVAGKIIDRLATPFILEGRQARVGTSIGIALFPRDGTDEETLLRSADNAMYEAKRAGRNGYRFAGEVGGGPPGGGAKAA